MTTAQAKPGPVLLVTRRWARDGGVATHVQSSAAALAEAGVDVHVLAAQIAEDAPAGVTLHESPRLLDAGAGAQERMAGALSGEPAIVHLHQVEDPDIVAFARRGAAVVVSAHGYPACTSGVYYFAPGQECTRAHGPGCVPNLIARGCAHTRYPRTLPRKYLGATRSVAALEQADLAVSYSMAVDRHLANNGLARRRVVPLFPTMPARQGAGHDQRRRVLFAGRIVRPKGVGVLIAAIRHLDAELVLCGDGRELEPMRALAERHGVGERVRFAGWLSAGELAQELADASLVAVPSLWPEPFGMVGIEAFAAGRPAVASATGGIVDWLRDGENGLAVAPGDEYALARALAELLADPERQRAMGEAGRALVRERFTAERHVGALLEAYEAADSAWRGARSTPASTSVVRSRVISRS